MTAKGDNKNPRSENRGAKRSSEGKARDAGRINVSEAEVIERFFNAPTNPNWPSSSLERRMQSSQG